MTPHPDNILPNGNYDPRMYDLAYEPAGKDAKGNRRYRVIRGLGNHIGFVIRIGAKRWSTGTVAADGTPAVFGQHWLTRQVAGHMLSHTVPLTQDAEIANPDAFRVDKESQNVTTRRIVSKLPPLEPHPSWPRPQIGWTFVHGPMNRCTGKTNRCTIDRIENGLVFWRADTEDAAARGDYVTPLFKFAANMARGEYFTDPALFRLTPKGYTCP